VGNCGDCRDCKDGKGKEKTIHDPFPFCEVMMDWKFCGQNRKIQTLRRLYKIFPFSARVPNPFFLKFSNISFLIGALAEWTFLGMSGLTFFPKSGKMSGWMTSANGCRRKI